MERHELIKHTSERSRQCRRLAAHTDDERTHLALTLMAEEIDADIARLLSENLDGLKKSPAEAGLIILSGPLARPKGSR